MNKRIADNEVREAADWVMSQLPEFWRQFRQHQVPRVCEEISWICVKEGTIVDLGGGSGFHAAICSRLGMRAICVDNFNAIGKDTICDDLLEPNVAAEEVATKLGVQMVHADVIDWDPTFECDSVDVVMTLDNIEHLNHSPRNVYRKMVRCLKPGGVFLLGAPNAANVLKRMRILRGKNIFAQMDEWYMHDRFIGHIREPVVNDLRLIAQDLNLEVVGVAGRNWLGLNKAPMGVARVAKGCDRVLRMFPSLCSDIYLLARKPPQ